MNAGEIGTEAGRIFEYNLPSSWIFRSQEDQNDFGNILLSFLELPVEEMKQVAKNGLDWYYETSTHKAVAIKFEKEILL